MQKQLKELTELPTLKKIPSFKLFDDDEAPSTPKRRPVYRNEQNKTPKIKYKYTIVQRPTSSKTNKILCFIWIILILISFWISFQTKLVNLQEKVKMEMEQCQKDYMINKCDEPVKGIREYCLGKHNCFNNSFQENVALKRNGALFFGQVVRQFAQGLGLPLLILGGIFIWLSSRKNRQTKKQFIEYFQ